MNKKLTSLDFVILLDIKASKVAGRHMVAPTLNQTRKNTFWTTGVKEQTTHESHQLVDRETRPKNEAG